MFFLLTKDQHQQEILDQKLIKVKYPIEFPRYQRSIKEMNNFKANEFRNILFYSAPFIFLDIFNSTNKKFYNHLLAFILAIRLLTKTNPTDDDINDASKLLNYFCQSFSRYYGEEELRFKLHAHTHYSDQVRKYGPLNQVSAFSFESN